MRFSSASIARGFSFLEIEMKRLPRSFYARPTLTVAKELLGATLVHHFEGQRLAGRIVEVEAYIGREDRACHARFGENGRARLLFGPPGFAYVFLIYGMYDCFNAVTEAAGSPAAVLVRALEPEDSVTDRTDGPGKLCRALHIDRRQSGIDLTSGELFIEEPSGRPPFIVATPRIGIDYAGEWAERPWRFIDRESRCLSKKYRPDAIAASSRVHRPV
jgi:DNA-3-methyladenine glycosylase